MNCSSGQRLEAIRWCEMAMSLLKHIGSLKSNYEPQVSHFVVVVSFYLTDTNNLHLMQS